MRRAIKTAKPYIIYRGGAIFMDDDKLGQLDERRTEYNTPIPPPSSEADSGEIYTAGKHSMDYFTVDGVILRTGYSHKYMWYLLCIRELLDNDADFLTKNFKGASDVLIFVQISKDDDYFRLKVRNSNYKNIRVFQNKAAIFDYDMRYGSKQDMHIISRGMLGDAMKQILAFGYILIHVNDDGTVSEDQQWEHPLIIRHNHREFKLFLQVDKIRQYGGVRIEESPDMIESADTEIDLTLPIIDEVKGNLNKQSIIDFCRKYPIFTTDITFRFEITDTSIPSRDVADTNDDDEELGEEAKTQIIMDAINNLESPMGITKIEYAALHPISSEVWNKQNSVHSYTLEEFKRRIVNMDNSQVAKTQVYDILREYREASNLAKKKEHEISVLKLLQLPDSELYRKITIFYDQLKRTLSPPPKLTLPYSIKDRKTTLITRLDRLYPDLLDQNYSKSCYKGLHGFYEDKKRKISFPYFFEILAVPIADPKNAKRGMIYFGAVNYSVPTSGEGVIFGGDYYRQYPDVFDPPTDIKELLETFRFNDDAEDTSKVPCVMVANLVTPRRDPHGQDKSRIDTTPFLDTIITAVLRLAPEIKSYRGVGLTFKGRSERRNAQQHDTSRGLLERLLTRYLVENHHLPAY